MEKTEEQIRHEIKNLDLRQNAIKILINSFYGAFGNKYFHFHNNDIAQSITLQGQDLIKFSIKSINHYFRNKWHLDTELHEKLGISQYPIHQITKDAATYTDTDSVYVCIDHAIQSIEGLSMTDTEQLEMCLAINRYRLAKYFGEAFEKYAAHFHTKNRQNFELENISRAGIWLAKKKYVLKVSYKDNKDEKLLEKESLIIKGLEAIQSSYPIWARTHLYNIYWDFLDIGTALDLDRDVIPRMIQLYEEIKTLSIDEIAFNFNVRVYDKYLTSINPLVIEKGMPIYGRASAYYNHILKTSNNEKYSQIREGSKIKFYYADPTTNEYNFDIFGYVPGSYPSEFAIPIDLRQQFFRLIVEPVNKILTALGMFELDEYFNRAIQYVKVKSSNTGKDNELYVVNSKTLEYFKIDPKFSKYIGSTEKVPDTLFLEYLSIIGVYGLDTMIVPKSELTSYFKRMSKKLETDFIDPFAVDQDTMEKLLLENGWTKLDSNLDFPDKIWVPTDKFTKLKPGKDIYVFAKDLEKAYKTTKSKLDKQ